jgi:hypothetical protein
MEKVRSAIGKNGIVAENRRISSCPLNQYLELAKTRKAYYSVESSSIYGKLTFI